MKSLLILLVVIIALLAFAAPVLAQEGDELPKTAVEAVEQVSLYLAIVGASVGGFLGNRLMTLLKDHVSWLSEEKRKAMGAGVTRIIALVMAEIGGVVSILLVDYAVKLDETGLWTSIITIVTLLGAPLISQLFHSLQKINKQPQLEA